MDEVISISELDVLDVFDVSSKSKLMNNHENVLHATGLQELMIECAKSFSSTADCPNKLQLYGLVCNTASCVECNTAPAVKLIMISSE